MNAIFIVLLQALVLTNIVGVELTRVDLNGNRVRVDCIVDLVVGPDFKTNFHVDPDDVTAFKSGTVAEKNAIRKKYARRAVKNYLDSLSVTPTETVQESGTRTKAQIQDAGDTP